MSILLLQKSSDIFFQIIDFQYLYVLTVNWKITMKKYLENENSRLQEELKQAKKEKSNFIKEANLSQYREIRLAEKTKKKGRINNRGEQRTVGITLHF